MRKTILIYFLSISFFSCDTGILTDARNEIIFENNSSYSITVSDAFGNDFESFAVAPGKQYTLMYKYSTFLETFYFTNDDKVGYTEKDNIITFSDLPTYEITFKNNSSYSITVTDSYGDDFESFTIASGEQYVLHYKNSAFAEIFAFTNDDKVKYTKVGNIITFDDDLYWDFDKFLSVSKFDTLLTQLSAVGNIDRAKIDEILDNLKVEQDYEYSYYSSGDYIAHTMLWSSYSSIIFDWIYYVDVDIWTDSGGNLRADMCSYYNGS